MELTLAILKPSAVERCLIGEIISRIQKKGLIIAGMKMMHLNEKYFVSIMLISLTNPFSINREINDSLSGGCDVSQRC